MKIERPIKLDLLTGEEIPCKNKEFFNSNLYCNKTNLVKHFKQISKNEAEKITKQLLLNRIKFKNIKYSLSTIEMQSLIFPSLPLLDKLNISYEKICEECNLINKYKYKLNVYENFSLAKKIYIDSREQIKLNFNVPTEITKLDFGDYALSDNLNNTLSIEKKNASDFIGTMSKGFERFCREVIRAEKANSNILIIIDSKIGNMLGFNYLPQFKWIKAQPSFIFSRLRELLQTFSNLQAVFVDGREESSKLTHFALSYGKEFLDYDVQYLYSSKQLDKYIK